MRLIGKLDNEDQARTFSDYLTQLDMDNQIVLESDGTCEIWVISEDDVKHAEQLFSKFRASPGGQEYRDVSKKAKAKRKQQAKEEKEQVPYIDVRTKVFSRGGRTPMGNLTLFLIIVAVLVTLLSRFGDNYDFLGKFFITDIKRTGNGIEWYRGLPEIASGQFWRLLTPIFIHFGEIHLLFNMMWLYDLGNMIEYRKGTWFLGLFIVITGIAGNLAQYMVSHPSFGGMSGVVYGLLGYAWMKSKYDPNSRIFLHKSTVTLMLFWFFFCFTGLAGNIANGAHAAGLIIGVIWGFFTSPLRKKFF
jgi:GlpG protein